MDMDMDMGMDMDMDMGVDMGMRMGMGMGWHMACPRQCSFRGRRGQLAAGWMRSHAHSIARLRAPSWVVMVLHDIGLGSTALKHEQRIRIRLA